MDAPGLPANLRVAVSETERLGEKLLETRERVLSLSKRQNGLREALRKLRALATSERRVWVLDGSDVWLRRAAPSIMDALTQEYEGLGRDIDALRVEQKRLAGLLADKGVMPEEVGPQLYNAYLTLRG